MINHLLRARLTQTAAVAVAVAVVVVVVVIVAVVLVIMGPVVVTVEAALPICLNK